MKQKWLEYFNETRKLNNVPEEQRCKRRAKISLRARRKAEECMKILTAIFQGMDYIMRNRELADTQLAEILGNDLAEEFLKTYSLARRRVVLHIKRKRERERRIPQELRRKLMSIHNLGKEEKEG